MYDIEFFQNLQSGRYAPHGQTSAFRNANQKIGVHFRYARFMDHVQSDVSQKKEQMRMVHPLAFSLAALPFLKDPLELAMIDNAKGVIWFDVNYTPTVIEEIVIGYQLIDNCLVLVQNARLITASRVLGVTNQIFKAIARPVGEEDRRVDDNPFVAQIPVKDQAAWDCDKLFQGGLRLSFG